MIEIGSDTLQMRSCVLPIAEKCFELHRVLTLAWQEESNAKGWKNFVAVKKNGTQWVPFLKCQETSSVGSAKNHLKKI